MDLARQLLVHCGRLLSVRRNEGLRDGVLHVLLDGRRNGAREGPSNVVGDIWTEEQSLDLIR